MVPVCDKRYHIYNRFRHFWAEIKKLWNYPFHNSSCLSIFGMSSQACRDAMISYTCTQLIMVVIEAGSV